jgi:hypothetical protein
VRVTWIVDQHDPDAFARHFEGTGQEMRLVLSPLVEVASGSTEVGMSDRG